MLAIGMITCHRPGINVHETIGQLRLGGFQEILHLFCEPGTPDLQPLPNVVVHRNPIQRGVLGNWAHCLQWLVEHTSADYLMVCEDDVLYAKGCRAAWEANRDQFKEAGYWSFYTPQRDATLAGNQVGWMARNRGRDTWGTLSLCFPRSSAERLVAYHPLHTEDQLRGHTDCIVAQCFLDAGIPCYYHYPSLADHIGRISTVGHNWYDNWYDLGRGLDFDPEFEPAYSLKSADGARASFNTEVPRTPEFLGEIRNPKQTAIAGSENLSSNDSARVPQVSRDKLQRPLTGLDFDLGGVGVGGSIKTVNLMGPADIQADITSVDAYAPEDRSVRSITLIHTLEHVPATKYVTFLKDLYRKLQPGGTVKIVQSDAGAVIEQWRNGDLSFRSMRSVLFTPPDRLRINPYHLHHNMWSAEEMARDLRAVGFSSKTFDAGSWSMDMQDELHDADIRRDHGKRIKNLGVVGTKPVDRVPNQLHFVFGMRSDFGGKPFGVIHYLAIKSAIAVNRPDRVRLWFAYEPTGTWWELARELVEVCRIVDYSFFQNIARDHYASRADVARLVILREHGGIYLDLDTICVRPFGDLLQHACTLGWEDARGTQLCNAIILAEPGAEFIDKLIEAQSGFRPGMWGEVSITAAGKLAKRFPELVNTLDHKRFFWPSWDDSGLMVLLSETPTDFPDAICHHLWEHVLWDRGLSGLTPDTIRDGRSNLCRILRRWL